MEESLGKIEHGELTYKDFLSGEWKNWLEEPYILTKQNGWLDCERPSPAQVIWLKKLADMCREEIPQEVIESKVLTGKWIERFKKEAPCIITQTGIEAVDVSGVPCFRFKLFFTKKPPDEIKEYLRAEIFKFRWDEKSGFYCHYQRKNKDDVTLKRDKVVKYLCSRSNELSYSVVEQ